MLGPTEANRTTPRSVFEQTRAAFSVWAHLGRLVRGPAREEARLRAVDGLRALAILWVIAFHTGVYSIGVLPPLEYVRLLGSPLMLPAWRGAFGVDVFFVLSGFLIAGVLIDERVKHGRFEVGMFYLRRLMRLFPALAVALAIDLATVELHRGTAWAVLLYVVNFVPVGRACMPWTWSLAIEEQFYLACPWLVAGLTKARPAARPWLLLGLALLLCGTTLYVVLDRGYLPFDVEIVPNRLASRWEAAFDDLYTKPWMRVGPLLAGVTAAHLFRRPELMRRFGTAKGLGFATTTAGLVVALGLGAASTHWPFFSRSGRAVSAVYMATFRTLFGAAVAYVLLLVTSEHPIGRALAKPLSSRLLWPIAQLSYCAYLLNPIVALLLRGALAARISRGEWSQPMLYGTDLVATFAAATALHVFVERPFMLLRPGRQTRQTHRAVETSSR